MKNTARWILSIGVAIIFLTPLLWMLRNSFNTEAEIFQPGLISGIFHGNWTLQNYADAWRRAAFGTALVNSLVQVVGIIGIGLFINSLAAYAFARFQFPGRELLFNGVIVLIILPIEVLAVPLFFTARDLGLTGGYFATITGLIAPFLVKAFNLYFLRQHFLNLPVELEEAAVIDGAGVWRQFWNIALPSVRPALATVVVLDLLTHWGDFLWPMMIGTREETRTVQTSLANLFTQPPIQWGAILACSVLATLPVLLVFRWLQRYIVVNDARAGIK
jgi:ABC-type glycerol-3-phosphate transport system permease component